ncbi:hypothetical protein ACFC9G_13405 [Enterococcus casseliflavus]|uniref:hypothetical protein n=1 Tax=Enterococcus casseliflavus TaxID=37734 RepID=UPI0039A4453C
MKEELEKKLDYIEDLNKIKSSNLLFGTSIKKFVSLKNFSNSPCIYIIFIVISITLAIFVKFQVNKLDLIINIVTYINDIILVLLGIVFAGYTLFQTSLSSKLLKKMIFNPTNSGERSTSRYVVLNESFFQLMALYIIGFLVNFVIFLILSTGSSFISILYDNFTCFFHVVFFVYIFFFFSVFWEIKFFIFNIYSLINTSIAQEGIDLISKEMKGEKDN